MVRCTHYLPRIRLEDGGVVRAVLDFCRVFAGLGHATTLVTADATDVPRAWQAGSALGLPKVVVIDPPRGALGLLPRSARQQIGNVLRETDVVHLHAPWETSNTEWATLARRSGIPYVLSAHGMLDDWSMAQRHFKKRAYLSLAGNRLLAGAARVHCTAAAELEQAQKWFPAGKGVVLPLIMDLSEYLDLPGPELARERFSLSQAGKPTLLFLSRVHPKKGIEILLRAAADLARSGTPCDVVIAGPGEARYIESLQKLAAELGLAEAVRFCRMVRGAEKISLFQAASIFVLPTSQENFGFVLLEALASGTRVITTRGVDIWQELKSAGATIVDGAPGAIATAVKDVLSGPATGTQGRDWVFEHLNAVHVAKAYATLYQQIIEKGP